MVKEWKMSRPGYYQNFQLAQLIIQRTLLVSTQKDSSLVKWLEKISLCNPGMKFLYSCQVNVVSYKARPGAKDFVQVEIIVEKNTQKIILIRKEGRALKLLSTAARLDIEDFLQKKVYLEIEVKVKENWRQDEGVLKHYGYGGQIKALL